MFRVLLKMSTVFLEVLESPQEKKRDKSQTFSE